MRPYILPAMLLASLSPVAVGAAPFSADTATASSEFNSGYVAENTINGTGLSSNTAVGEAHLNYAFGNHWTTDGSNPTDEYIEWGFSTPVTLGGIYIWNHRSNIIAANSGYEPTLFDLTIKGAGGSILGTFSDVSLAPDTATAQSFTFAIFSGVESVLFEVGATQSSPSYTGLAEVAFDDATISGATVLGGTTAVPLPAALPLMAGALGLFPALRRRNGAKRG